MQPEIFESAEVKGRAQQLFLLHQRDICTFTDRLFVGLMIFQWVGSIFLALWVSPKAWGGQVSQVHVHVWAAIGLGGLIAVPAIWLGIFRAGEKPTRYLIATAQMLFSALLIHLTGGRIETHFHVFGSLAFLAFYRDWKVLIPATLVVAADHWLRGVYWPASVYGVVLASPWRWVEHSAWVVFEDLFLISSCRRSVREMKNIAEQTARLESSYQAVEEKVADRTAELVKSKSELETEVAERKRLEIAIVQSEKMAAVGQLAGELARDIDNPVSFIQSNLEALERRMKHYSRLFQSVEGMRQAIRGGNLQEAREALDKIQGLEKEARLDSAVKEFEVFIKESNAGTEKIKKIVWELRSSARAEMANELGLIKIEKVIEDVLILIRAEIERKAELKKDYGKTPRLCLNAPKMGQVFINLLLNAAQSIEQNGVIEVRTYTQNGHVCVEVEDTGRGIEEKNLANIFSPSSGARSLGKSTGLGLSVSYEIVKKYGGDIRVKSQVGKGSVFTVLIPST